MKAKCEVLYHESKHAQDGTLYTVNLLKFSIPAGYYYIRQIHYTGPRDRWIYPERELINPDLDASATRSTIQWFDAFIERQVKS